MKIKSIVILAFLIALVFSIDIKAQSKIQDVEIKTSAQCDMCKARIEEVMAYTKGVRKSNLDVESKILKVSFNTRKTSIEDIRKAVNKVGYDADDMKAEIKPYEKLPMCCQKGGAELHKE